MGWVTKAYIVSLPHSILGKARSQYHDMHMRIAEIMCREHPVGRSRLAAPVLGLTGAAALRRVSMYYMTSPPHTDPYM